MNKKAIITILVLLVLVIGVGVGVFLVQRNIEIREKAAPSTNLSLVSDTDSPIVGQSFSALVNINTGENQVIGAEMYITYDPLKLEIVSVDKGTFLPNPVIIGPDIDNSSGTLSYTIYIPPGSTPVTGSGTLAVIEFKTKQEGSATVSFTSESKVGAVQEGGVNVLVGTTPLSLNIQGTSVELTNTPTPTGVLVQETVTPTPTGQVTNTPTPTEADGTGGTTLHTNTPTPTTRPSSTSTPTSFNPASSEGDTTLPDTGVSTPTIILVSSGILIFIVSLIIAL